MDDVLVANVSSTVFTTGVTGFFSAGMGWFDDAKLTTVCDGGKSCVGACPAPAFITLGLSHVCVCVRVRRRLRRRAVRHDVLCGVCAYGRGLLAHMRCQRHLDRL